VKPGGISKIWRAEIQRADRPTKFEKENVEDGINVAVVIKCRRLAT